jgi:segregation and condensation protein B
MSRKKKSSKRIQIVVGDEPETTPEQTAVENTDETIVVAAEPEEPAEVAPEELTADEAIALFDDEEEADAVAEDVDPANESLYAGDSSDDSDDDSMDIDESDATVTTDAEELTELEAVFGAKDDLEEVEALPDEAVGELGEFQPVEIEETVQVEADSVRAVVEALLFATDRPMSFESMRGVFKGTNVKSADLKQALSDIQIEMQAPHRGVSLEEVAGGWQVRTKVEHGKFLRQAGKVKPFRLSGPALEVMSIVAYKQPLVKGEIDEIRGVESGHLLRALMDRGLVRFAGKSDLPGKPMLYETTRKFLEIFGLMSIKELPTPADIDSLIPDGIGEPEAEVRKLGDITDELSLEAGSTYSEGEEELTKITGQLSEITTSSEFFEQEKKREKDRRDAEKAREIRDALVFGQPVEKKDIKWLERYERALAEAEAPAALAPDPQAEGEAEAESEVVSEVMSASETDSELASDSVVESAVESSGEATVESEDEMLKRELEAAVLAVESSPTAEEIAEPQTDELEVELVAAEDELSIHEHGIPEDEEEEFEVQSPALPDPEAQA